EASGEGGSSGGNESSGNGGSGSSDGESSGGSVSSGNGGSGSSGGNGEKNSGKKDKIFDANSTALFSKGVLAGELDDKETLVFNLILHKTNETSLLLHDADFYGKEADLMISLRDNSWKYRLKIEDGRPILHVYLKAKARLDDTSRTVSPQTLSTSYSVPDNVLKDLETKIESELTEIFYKCKDLGCDAFRVRERLYRTQNDYFEGYKNTALKEAAVKVEVTAESYK
ncbi:MAG: Ger(x)C family spore germination C-terminal domain-containing protein, partial [Clostridia bacterium]|nr:Ger(x)C family spore germination C-terminal domain-containing protein [Clostridia bacterium]